jgi:hypothetical protein
MNILCLAHDAEGHANGCQKRDQCKRNLAFRSRQFPESESILGIGCTSNDYLLFIDKDADHADD